MKIRYQALALTAAAAVGAAAGWRLKPVPAPGPVRVQVDTVTAEAARPDLKRPSLGERLQTSAVTPTQTRLAEAPSSTGLERVELYCRPPVRIVRDTSNQLEKQEPPDVLPDFAGRRRRSSTTLFSTLSDGRRWAADYRTRGDCEWESSGDSVLWRCDRLWKRIARGAMRCAPPAAGAGAIGALVDTDRPLRGLVLGSIAAAAGCIF